MDILIFELVNRQWGLDLALVREVTPLGPVTPIPGAPPELLGAMNLRGHVTAVLDLALLLTRQLGRPRPAPAQTLDAGLLVEVGQQRLVACVGRVREVARLELPSVVSTGGLSGVLSNVIDDPALGVVAVVDLEAVVAALRARMGRAAAALREAAA